MSTGPKNLRAEYETILVYAHNGSNTSNYFTAKLSPSRQVGIPACTNQGGQSATEGVHALCQVVRTGMRAQVLARVPVPLGRIRSAGQAQGFLKRSTFTLPPVRVTERWTELRKGPP
jgi:hypothetical protein